jgi:hypothetical protein
MLDRCLAGIIHLNHVSIFEIVSKEVSIYVPLFRSFHLMYSQRYAGVV